MSARILTKWAVHGLLIVSASSVPLCNAAEEKNGNVREKPGTTIVMDDGFEYRLVDFGVGRLQGVRSAERSLSPHVFWIVLRITNRSAHSLGVAKYFHNYDSLTVKDNWGNTYESRSPQGVYGIDWDLFPGEQADNSKPGEASLEIREFSLSRFVEDVHNLRAYLKVYGLRSKQRPFFLLREPMSRQRDLLREQSEPSATDLPVTTGVEIRESSTATTRREPPTR